MSKQNAAKFLEAVSDNASLQKKLMDGPATTQAWIAAAKGAGHEFGEEDLRSVTEQIAGKPVAAGELVGALRSLFEGELGDDSLEAVAGGAGGATGPIGTKLRIQTVSRQITSAGDVMDGFAREGGPMGVSKDPTGGKTNPGSQSSL